MFRLDTEAEYWEAAQACRDRDATLAAPDSPEEWAAFVDLCRSGDASADCWTAYGDADGAWALAHSSFEDLNYPMCETWRPEP